MKYRYQHAERSQSPRCRQWRTIAAGVAAVSIAGLTTLDVSIAGEPTKLEVMASIKPVHSLVSGVMDGVGTPKLIVTGAASPHTYALKPSQARAMQSADVIFWVSPQIESFLEKPLASLGQDARVVELVETAGLKKLDLREGGTFEAHAHEEHAEHGEKHADHDNHKHGEKHSDHDEDHKHGAKRADRDDHDDHAHGKKNAKHDDHAHGEKHAEHDGQAHGAKKTGHEGHGHDETDNHVWLDPENARVLVEAIAAELAKADPKNAAAYRTNATAMKTRLDTLIADVRATVAPAKGRGFIVFHDAYRYFEERFGLEAAGAISVSPEVIPGAARVAEIRSKVKELGATCVFSEPQFEPKLVSVVTEGTAAKSGVLDPLGSDITDGPGLYFELIRNLGQSFAGCLGKAS